MFFFVFFFLVESLSPFYHTSFSDVHGMKSFLLNYEHQWENAKAYDFLGNFSHQSRLGGYSQGIFFVSEVSALIALIFDVPIVDLAGKWTLLKFTFFSLYTVASYGCFLFFRYGLRLPLIPSFLGGLGFFFGNAALLSFLGNMYSVNIFQFLFFPLVLLFVKLSHSLNRLSIACLAGLIASLVEYTQSAHPVLSVIYFCFINLYNIYLALVRVNKEGFELENLKNISKFILVFPLFHFFGLAYRVIPLFSAMLSKEFAIYDVNYGNPTLGFWWDGEWKHFSTFFFRFEDTALTGVSYFPANGAANVAFYTGQFAGFLTFAFFCGLLTLAYQKFFKKEHINGQNLRIADSVFFIVIFLILATGLPLGSSSWLSNLMELTGALRLHSALRIQIYFYFFALVMAMYGLAFVLQLKKIFHLAIIVFGYLVLLLMVFFSPLTPGMPEGLVFDGGIFLATVVLLWLMIASNSSPKNKTIIRYRPLISFVLVGLGLFSYLTINSVTRNIATNPKNPSHREFASKDQLFVSFRTAVTRLRNNSHDKASFTFLDKKVEKFKRDLKYKFGESMLHSNSFERIMSIFKKYEGLDLSDFGDEKNSNWHNRRMQLYEAIAPALDNFYLNYWPTLTLLGADSFYDSPYVTDIFNTVQFYFPDKYNLFGKYNHSISPFIRPVGKNSDFSMGAFIGTGPAYPSIDVNFILQKLYVLDNNSTAATGVGWYAKPLTLDRTMALETQSKKMMNIIGVDYLIFSEYHLNTYASPQLILDNFKSMGFVYKKRPESFSFSPRYPEGHHFHVFQNPQSYGKAYIAKVVQVIKPEDNMMNLSIFDLPKRWPNSRALMENFDQLMSKVSENIWRSVLIESSDQADFTDFPETYNMKNDVEIVKIIGSKAVFDVDCQEETCWFVYNAATLNGWKAYSGSEQIPIYNANLGLIGLKLSRGKHLVWMEYQSYPTIAGFIITIFGWTYAFLYRIYQYQFTAVNRFV
jgi:hypothetical protein